jgi:CspA family cold shock protein
MMPFADKMLRCAQCGTEFIFTVDEQRRMAEAGQEVVEPTLCPVCRSEEKITVRELGRVKWFDSRKGYGFIVRENGEEVFVHRTGIEGEGFQSLQDAQEVEFEVEDTPKGPQAIHVLKL